MSRKSRNRMKTTSNGTTKPVLPTLLQEFAEHSKLNLHPHELILLGQAWDVEVRKNTFGVSRLCQSNPVLSKGRIPFHRETLRMTHVLTPTRTKSVPSGCVSLMHASPTSCAAGILVRGFKLPQRHGMFGRGIYFTDSQSKAFNYLGPDGGIIVKARINLGRVLSAEKAMTHLHPDNVGSDFDTVKGTKDETKSTWSSNNLLLHNEWCIYHQSRIFIDRVEVWSRQA